MKTIVGWKSIATHCGFHVQTIRAWHYTRRRLPLMKTTAKKQGKVMIFENELNDWLRGMKIQDATK